MGWTLLLGFAAAGCRSRVTDNLLDGHPPEVMPFSRNGHRLVDGVVAPAGARWDSTLTAVIDSGGSMQWDLGRVERLTRAYVQADNNDIYALLVSTDGKNWQTAWEAGPVAEVGMQARQTDRLDVHARYVRLEPRAGDGSYSVSELVLSSKTDGPWPPRLEIADGTQQEILGLPPLDGPLMLAFVLAAAALLASRLRPARPGLLREPLSWITLGLVAFLAVTVWSYARLNRFNVADDAYISFQYAKNWISGHGLVFNPGERVEGYTNFLWVAVVAPLWPLSGHDPELMTRAAVGLAGGLAALGLALVALIGHRALRVRSATALALLLVVFDDSTLSYAATFALENHLLIVITLAGLALLLYRPRYWEWGLGASFALAGMTRPDALLWAATFFAVYAAPLFLRRGPHKDGVEQAALVRVGIAFVGLFGTYFVLRAWYFGDLLPNTFYLKVASTLTGLARGLRYVYSYGADRWGMPLVALASAFLVRSLWVRWLAVHAVLHMAYIMYVGGDFYLGHRFLLVLTPNLALLTGVLFARWLDGAGMPAKKRRLAWVAALVICLGERGSTMRHGPYSAELHHWETVVDNNVKFMQWLGQVARPNSSMVVGDIGATGLFADVRVLDVFGVVDREVARKVVPSFGTGKAGHEKMATRQELLARDPTYVKWGYIDDREPPAGYYLFNDFPLYLRVDGMWVKDDRTAGQPLTAWHCEREELEGWTRQGDAFAEAPSGGVPGKQSPILGQRGLLINSFHSSKGDEATGRMVSPPMTLVGDRMRLLVGGGRDPERLRVSLLVQDRRVFSETGNNAETLGRREWDISSLRGQTARIEIEDSGTGVWGHIMVDEIEQWQGKPDMSGKL